MRDFSYVAPEIPEYIRENCTGCMDCVTECPDTAILGKVISEPDLEAKLAEIPNEEDRQVFEAQWSKTRKYYEGPQKKGLPGGRFAIIIDPSKCKGCAECVTVCDDLALKMIPKTEPVMESIRKIAPAVQERRARRTTGTSTKTCSIDMMLKEQTHVYVGGAGSCAGCGEGTALRMMCAATGAKYGDQWGIVAATGCNTVYTSTYPYNPYLVPWTNSLFENAPADAMGVRVAVGPDGLAGQAAVVHRRRRRVVRHRLSVAVADVRLGHCRSSASCSTRRCTRTRAARRRRARTWARTPR